ncbi:hypothetical protein [Nonomuraea wenchangensis]|uniref:hypothetical protein n=1 Tax=Nonomuraea wenchangensis TaxID=568860 RepID=UPI001160163E|nr:hypothetical protein [Nonomuraea wenchangensis]
MVILLAGLFVLAMNPVWRDDARLQAFYERVVAYPLPPNTRDIFPMDRDVVFGKNLVGGGGSYCDYRVRLTLQTALTPQEIRRHYDHAAIAGAEAKAEISLYFREQDPAGGRRVILEAYDSHDWDWDWRCY